MGVSFTSALTESLARSLLRLVELDLLAPCEGQSAEGEGVQTEGAAVKSGSE
jgi:hypothetical protein